MQMKWLLAGCTSILALGGVAQAQETPASSQEATDSDEIVVTASKRGEQSLQDTPLAIQAFTGESLTERNINNLTDLIGAVPGVSDGFNQATTARAFNLRGVAVAGTNGDSMIGYYLDDVPFVVPNFGIAPPIRFIDLDRVEVLRGPQGTLYGQGSAGGTMIFRTRDPNLHQMESMVETIVSSTNDASGANYGVSGAVSIPLIEDQLAIRVSGGFTSNSGYADVYYGPQDGSPDETDANGSENTDFRVVALWEPTPNIQVRGQVWQFRPNQDYVGSMNSVDPYYFENTGGVVGSSRGKFTLYSLSANVDLGSVELTNTISYFDGMFGLKIPVGGGVEFSSFFFPTNFSEELRINSTGDGPFHWVLGAQYQDGEGPSENIVSIPAIPLTLLDGSNTALTTNWAVFGEASYDLLDGKLVPLVGLRYYHDERTYEEGAVSQPSTEDVTTWRLNLSYIPNDNLTTFITAATGFRAGIIQSALQANALLADGVPTSTALNPETLTNYEAGVRWRTADDSLTIGLNVYHIDLEDIQASIASSIPGVAGYTNFGSGHTEGVDIEINWRTPLDGLSLSAVGNFNDGSFDEVDPEVQLALPLVHPGGRLIQSVQENYQLSANYNGQLTSDTEIFGNASWTHFGDQIMAIGAVVEPYSLVNGLVGVRRGPWELALTLENMTDERGPNYIFLPTFLSGPTPRTIGLRLRANFQ